MLDLAHGRPAAGIAVRLERAGPDHTWIALGSATTDGDGRTGDLAGGPLVEGVHRLTFETGAYFASLELRAFHPRVAVSFEVVDPGQHHHVPLLVAPFGYSTYRGS